MINTATPSIKSARLQAWIRCKIREAERFTAFFRLIDVIPPWHCSCS